MFDLARHHMGMPPANYDAVLVLGGGVREGGVLPTWVERRLDAALAVPGEPLLITLSAGTTHRPPPRDASGFPLFEATASGTYLLNRGVPAERILIEACSWDTIGNAYFSRVMHTQPAELKRLLIVTSDWHMPRTRFLFDWVYGLPPLPFAFELDYQEAHDPEMSEQLSTERLRKEQASVELVRGLAGQIGTLPDLHRWLFTRHEAYKAGGSAFRSGALAGGALDSY